MIVSLGLHHFSGLQLTECVFEIGDGAFSVPDRRIVLPQHFCIIRGLSQELRGLEDFALCLDPFVDILYLLVELMRLISFISQDRLRI